MTVRGGLITTTALFWVAFSGAAKADPVTIGSLILGASATAATTVVIGGASVALGAWVVGTVVTTAVTSAALRALSPSSSSGNAGDAQNKGTLVNSRQSAAPQEYVYGTVRKGGTVTFMATSGTENKFFHMVVCLSGVPVSSIGEVYLDGEPVALDGSGLVTNSRWGGKVYIYKHHGNQTSIYDQFANATTSLRDTLVSECALSYDFVGRGIAYIYARFEYDADVFGGGLPVVTAVVNGREVYDPRTGLTGHTSNAALILRDYITSPHGLNDPAVDDDYFSAAANDCDDSIALAAGGSQARYTVDGVVSAASPVGVSIADMLDSCNGIIPFSGGRWKLKVGVYSAPVKTLGLDDLRSGISLSTRVPRRDNFNIATGRFISGFDWVETDFPAVKSAAFLAQDGGIENALDFDFNMITDSARAQRVAKQKLWRLREQMTFSAEFSLAALGLEVGDIVALNIPKYGFAAKEFEVVSWRLVIGDTGAIRVAMSLRETSEAAFDWNGEEVAIIRNDTNLRKYSDVPNIGISVSNSLTVTNEQLANIVKIGTTAEDGGQIDYVQVQYRASGSDAWVTAGHGSLGEFDLIGIDDGFYDFRARPVNGVGYKGAWVQRDNYQVLGLSLPPANVEGFSAEVIGDAISLSWSAVPDLDLSHYVIRHSVSQFGATWANSTVYVEKIARPATDVTVPARAGTFMIVAVDKTGSQSVAASKVVVSPDEIRIAATVLSIEEHPDFAGAKTNTFVEAGSLRIGNAALFDDLVGDLDGISGGWDLMGIDYTPMSGEYVFDQIIERASPELGFVSVSVNVTRRNSIGGTFDDLAGNLDAINGLWDDMTGEPEFGDTDVLAYVSTTNDDPSGSPVWSDWRFIRSANVYGRALRFKVVLQTRTAAITPAISGLTATATYG